MNFFKNLTNKIIGENKFAKEIKITEEQVNKQEKRTLKLFNKCLNSFIAYEEQFQLLKDIYECKYDVPNSTLAHKSIQELANKLDELWEIVNELYNINKNTMNMNTMENVYSDNFFVDMKNISKTLKKTEILKTNIMQFNGKICNLISK